MAKWRVRKYTWKQYKGGVGYGERGEAEEVVEAEGVLLVDSALHFFNNYDRQGNPITEAVRVKGEWFAVDKVKE